MQKEEKPMRCIYCQGEMRLGTAPFNINRKGYHLMFDAIPAWVCPQCGEVYFEETEVQRIQEIIRSVDKQTERLAISA